MLPSSLSGSGRLWPLVFFVGVVTLGLTITTDYGLYIDEFTNHYFGVAWYEYVRNILVNGAPIAPLANATEHDIVHGPVFEMTLAWLEKLLGISDIRQIVFFRHYATWLTFCLGIACSYLLALRLWKSRWLALASGSFLLIHPRIFSHAFYDSVDISLLSFYTASIYTLVRYLDRRTVPALCIHATACALAIDIRSIAAVIPVLTLLLLAIDLIAAAKRRRPLLLPCGHLAGFAILVGLLTIAFWPYLWDHPHLRVLEVVRQTPRINWAGIVLYNGRLIIAPELPWHYIPVWILITTPITISIFFFVGIAELLFAVVRGPVTFYQERRGELAIATAFLVPLTAVIVLQAVVYDAWRHLFFIYPAFVLIAVGGLRNTLRWLRVALAPRAVAIVQMLGGVLIGFNFATVGWFMIENHPYQNVYFNRLAGRDMTAIKRRFEMDYWGLSYRRALEHLMQTDPSNPIKIFHSRNAHLAINRQILSATDQARIQQVEWPEADYVITTFREARDGYPDLLKYFSIQVEGEDIVCIYRKKPAIRE